MVQIAGHYDPDAEPSGDFDPIPAGRYRARIIESAIEEISKRDNKGRCLKLTWQVETGAYDGRLVWQRLNMWPENMNNMDKVTQIANSQFAAIRQATGRIAVQDSEELHHIACVIGVKVRTDPNGQYAPQNEVTSVGPADGTPAAAPAAGPPRSAAPAAPAAPAGGKAAGARPWAAAGA